MDAAPPAGVGVRGDGGVIVGVVGVAGAGRWVGECASFDLEICFLLTERARDLVGWWGERMTEKRKEGEGGGEGERTAPRKA